mgnify:CR=1 FL=1
MDNPLFVPESKVEYGGAFVVFVVICILLTFMGSYFGWGYYGSDEYKFINSGSNGESLPDADFTTP